ncbi:MAG: FadR family transcriptional regulator [Planctomycetaceae bacterium]|jgi:GntR family transcriptional repressor for pyruvate dehydrogenase complex|nr:FadR family transcriptional regulator [Planctomycetaceae bacterium]
MKTLRRPKVRDQVASQIQQYIVEQKLGPGDRLPTEAQLAATFGISRLSLREATKSLEFLGIVESKTGVGLTVGSIDMERLTEHLSFHAGLLDADSQQLIDSRVILETGVLPHIARRMKEDSSIESRLRELVEQFRSARDLKSWIELDVRFHRSLLEASGLQPLVAFGDLLHIFFQRFRESVKKAGWKAGVESHDRIVDELAKGRVEAATAELRKHIESHKERLS